MKAQIKQAFLDMPKNDAKAFASLSDGKDTEFVAVEPATLQPVIDMVKFNDEQRKKGS